MVNSLLYLYLSRSFKHKQKKKLFLSNININVTSIFNNFGKTINIFWIINYNFLKAYHCQLFLSIFIIAQGKKLIFLTICVNILHTIAGKTFKMYVSFVKKRRKEKNTVSVCDIPDWLRIIKCK